MGRLIVPLANVFIVSVAASPAIATAADTVHSSNIVLDPTKALVGVSGYAQARHPDDVGGSLALCPSGTNKVAPVCIEPNSSVSFSYSWEIINFDHDGQCDTVGTHGGDYYVTIENGQDSCSGSGCSTNAQTIVFYGYKSCSFTCTWSWTYHSTVSVAANSSTTLNIDLNFSAGQGPDGILLGRSTQATSVSDPRWVEVDEICHAI